MPALKIFSKEVIKKREVPLKTIEGKKEKIKKKSL